MDAELLKILEKQNFNQLLEYNFVTENIDILESEISVSILNDGSVFAILPIKELEKPK
jgi:hypothetical protein